MDELISKQAAIDKLNERQRKLIYCFGFENDAVKIMDIAKSIITAMPTEQPKQGEWKYHSNPTIGINPETAYCSCCGLRVDTTGDIDFDEYNFCPHCGAKMER